MSKLKVPTSFIGYPPFKIESYVTKNAKKKKGVMSSLQAGSGVVHYFLFHRNINSICNENFKSVDMTVSYDPQGIALIDPI